LKLSQEKEYFKIILHSEVALAALFSYFSSFHHRGTVSRNYYANHYIKNESWNSTPTPINII